VLLARCGFVQQEPQFPGLGLATTPSHEKLVLLPDERARGKLIFASRRQAE
jgi:hypothetical protein